MSQASDRRNPLRLIVSKDTQLRILSLVGGAVFFSMAVLALAWLWLGQWIWTLAVGIACGAVASLWVSRQIAGPFYRIQADLEAVLDNAAEGREIRLRPGDPLHHLAELVNRLIERSRQAPKG